MHAEGVNPTPPRFLDGDGMLHVRGGGRNLLDPAGRDLQARATALELGGQAVQLGMAR